MILLELFFRVTKWGPLTHALIIEQGSPISYSDLWYEIHGPKFGSEFQTGPTGDEGNRGRMFLRLWRNLGGLELSRRLEVGNYVGGIRRFVCVGRGQQEDFKILFLQWTGRVHVPVFPPKPRTLLPTALNHRTRHHVLVGPTLHWNNKLDCIYQLPSKLPKYPSSNFCT